MRRRVYGCINNVKTFAFRKGMLVHPKGFSRYCIRNGMFLAKDDQP
jgi:hypothetical protein